MKPKTKEYKIIITNRGDLTSAQMFVDGRRVREAQAKRNPEDKFSLKTGVELALSRIWEKKTEKKPKRVEDPARPVPVFEIGDRVVIEECANPYISLVGLRGKVVAFKHNLWIGVELECKYLPFFHDCDGKGEAERCLWLCRYSLKKVSRFQPFTPLATKK